MESAALYSDVTTQKMMINQIYDEKIRIGIESIRRNERVVIYGAGEYGKHIFRELIPRSIQLISICDSNPGEKNIYGYGVETFEESLAKHIGCTYVVSVVNIHDKETIISKLIKCGIESDRIVVPLELSGSFFFDKSILMNFFWNKNVIKRQLTFYGNISEFFIYNGWYLIALYDNIGIFNEIEKFVTGAVRIRQVICDADQLNEDLCDAILVVDEGRFDLIEEQLLMVTQKPIISLWEIITS